MEKLLSQFDISIGVRRIGGSQFHLKLFLLHAIEHLLNSSANQLASALFQMGRRVIRPFKQFHWELHQDPFSTRVRDSELPGSCRWHSLLPFSGSGLFLVSFGCRTHNIHLRANIYGNYINLFME